MKYKKIFAKSQPAENLFSPFQTAVEILTVRNTN